MSPTEQQRAILEASLGLLAASGPQALRVRDIADAADCTTMAVYSRFGGKDGVVEAIFVDGFERFTVALEDAMPGPIEQRLVRMGNAYRDWARANAGSYQVMFTEAIPGFQPSDRAAAIALDSFATLVRGVESTQDAGFVRAGEPNPIAWALWGLTHGLVMLELAGMHVVTGEADVNVTFEQSLRAIVTGFAPATGIPIADR